MVVSKLDNIPVYTIRREDGKGKPRTLHRNHLLPFLIQPQKQRDLAKGKNRSERSNSKQRPTGLTRNQEEDSTESDSSDNGLIRYYVEEKEKFEPQGRPVDLTVREETSSEDEVENEVREPLGREQESSVAESQDQSAAECAQSPDRPRRSTRRKKPPDRYTPSSFGHTVTNPPWQEKAKFMMTVLGKGNTNESLCKYVMEFIAQA